MNKVLHTCVLFMFVVFGVLFNWFMTLGLPQNVAIHFDIYGKPDGFTALKYHQTFTIIFTLFFPLFMVFMVGVLPAWFPSLVNIPNRDYWFANQRKKQTLDFLYAMAVRLGLVMVLFFMGLNFITTIANNSKPVVLPVGLSLTLLIGFLTSIFLWVICLFLKFRKFDPFVK